MALSASAKNYANTGAPAGAATPRACTRLARNIASAPGEKIAHCAKNAATPAQPLAPTVALFARAKQSKNNLRPRAALCRAHLRASPVTHCPGMAQILRKVCGPLLRLRSSPPTVQCTQHKVPKIRKILRLPTLPRHARTATSVHGANNVQSAPISATTVRLSAQSSSDSTSAAAASLTTAQADARAPGEQKVKCKPSLSRSSRTATSVARAKISRCYTTPLASMRKSLTCAVVPLGSVH